MIPVSPTPDANQTVAPLAVEGVSSPGQRHFRAVSLDRYATVVLVLILAAEFVLLVTQASRKSFWFDEILTYDVSSLHPLSHLWAALQAGVDAMPPEYYGLVLLARTIPGDPHVILRLVSIFGYLFALIGVYFFVSKRYSPVAGLIGVLLLTLTPFRAYAIEARCYGILVGLLAVAAALWQRIDEEWWITPLFAVSLTLGVSTHYLAVILLPCFGLAELTFAALSRRIRWKVWISIAIGAVPFLLSLPVLAHYKQLFGKHFWAQPAWSMFLWTDGNILQVPSELALSLVLFVVLTCAALVWKSHKGLASDSASFSPPEAVLIAGLLIYPSILVAVAELQGSGYTTRYGWPAILGAVLGLFFLIRPTRDRATALRFLSALLIAFCIHDAELALKAVKFAPKTFDKWPRLEQLSQLNPEMPVVVSYGVDYLEMDRYAAPELRKRLCFIGDTDTALLEVDSNSLERNVALVSEFFPLHVEHTAPFLASHHRFLLYSTSSRTESWLPKYLIENDYRLTLRYSDLSNLVYEVQN
jgi:hypothetical protein